MKGKLPIRPKVAIDWRQYFLDFCEKHGRPLLAIDGRRLLFPDGWSYGLDHKGPEWRPPDDPTEYWRQVLQYWRLYRVGVSRELVRAREELAGVRAALESRSAPMTVASVIRDPDTGKATRVTRPLAVEEFEQAVAGLELDLADVNAKVLECETELRLLRMPRPDVVTQGTPR